jgi:hypothetical protein
VTNLLRLCQARVRGVGGVGVNANAGLVINIWSVAVVGIENTLPVALKYFVGLLWRLAALYPVGFSTQEVRYPDCTNSSNRTYTRP